MISSSEIASQIKVEKAKLSEFKENLVEMQAYVEKLQSLKEKIKGISKSLSNNLKFSVRKAVSGDRGSNLARNVNKPVESFDSAVSNLNDAIRIAESNDIKWIKKSIIVKEEQIEELTRRYYRALERESANE